MEWLCTRVPKSSTSVVAERGSLGYFMTESNDVLCRLWISRGQNASVLFVQFLVERGNAVWIDGHSKDPYGFGQFQLIVGANDSRLVW